MSAGEGISGQIVTLPGLLGLATTCCLDFGTNFLGSVSN